MLQESYAELVSHPPDEYLPVIRELLSYDSLCPTCCAVARGPSGEFILERVPSPLHWSRQVEWPWAVLESNLREHHHVLDVGSGWSVLKYALAKRCNRLTALDLDEPSIEKSKATTKLLGFGNISYVQADAQKLPFPDGSFSRVFCISVLEHVRVDHRGCVAEIVRVLRPGGIAMITLDFLVEGSDPDDFFIDQVTANTMMMDLGIDRLRGTGKEVIYGGLIREGLSIAALKIKYVKPEERR